MEPVRYKTKIKGNEIVLPDDVLQKIGRDMEVEIVVRPAPAEKKNHEDIDTVLAGITEAMNRKYPNLDLAVHPRLRAVAGVSSGVKSKWSGFSDKEIATMGRMEKQMEKGEILESLY